MNKMLKKAANDHSFCEKLQKVAKDTARVRVQFVKVYDLMNGVGKTGDILEVEREKLNRLIDDTCREVYNLNREYHFMGFYDFKDPVARYEYCMDAEEQIDCIVRQALEMVY